MSVGADAPLSPDAATSAVPAPLTVTVTAARTTAAEMASANAAAWPFAAPSVGTLRASPKKVFAHYFTPFPVSLDNKPPEQDYYSAEYLAPGGEGGRYAGSGGYIKQRPMPRTVLAGGTWDQTDVQQDVRRAAALGIDGFAVDLLASSGVQWLRALRLLDTANAVEPGFKVLLMPDMEAEFKTNPGNLLPAIRRLATYPAAYRLYDGRLVLAPYNAQNQSVAWWSALLSTLRAEGTPVAFFPVFQGWSNHAAAYAPISAGMSDWGDRSPGTNRNWRSVPAQAHGYGTLWMSPVSPQDMRPKDLAFWEARNSENYRVMWENAILGDADWVQVISWNDYSESSEIAPSTGTQWSFYDLTAYYTAWFKTGTRPTITRDAIYYFHRRHASSAAPDLGRQTRAYSRFPGSDTPADDIEVVAFTTAPSTLKVTVGSQVTERQVTTGMSAVRVPLTEGTPVFELLRGGTTVASVRSAYAISNRIVWQDLLYRSGSSTRTLVAPR